jgi:hypothetical protein
MDQFPAASAAYCLWEKFDLDQARRLTGPGAAGIVQVSGAGPAIPDDPGDA